MKKTIIMLVTCLVLVLLVFGIYSIVNTDKTAPAESVAGTGTALPSSGATGPVQPVTGNTEASGASEGTFEQSTQSEVAETEHIEEEPIVGKEYDISGFTLVMDENGKVWITDYHGTDTELRIWGSSFGMLKPSAIGPGAFANSEITYFMFGGELTEIGERAFENCTKLEYFSCNAYKPDALTRIGYRAFAGTASLKEFAIDEDDTVSRNIVFIEPETFDGSGIGILRINGAYQIKERAFANCPNLRELWIPANTMVIADSMIEGTPNVVVYCPTYSKAMEWCKEREVMAMDSGKTRGQK